MAVSLADKARALLVVGLLLATTVPSHSLPTLSLSQQQQPQQAQNAPTLFDENDVAPVRYNRLPLRSALVPNSPLQSEQEQPLQQQQQQEQPATNLLSSSRTTTSSSDGRLVSPVREKIDTSTIINNNKVGSNPTTLGDHVIEAAGKVLDETPKWFTLSNLPEDVVDPTAAPWAKAKVANWLNAAKAYGEGDQSRGADHVTMADKASDVASSLADKIMNWSGIKDSGFYHSLMDARAWEKVLHKFETKEISLENLNLEDYVKQSVERVNSKQDLVNFDMTNAVFNLFNSNNRDTSSNNNNNNNNKAGVASNVQQSFATNANGQQQQQQQHQTNLSSESDDLTTAEQMVPILDAMLQPTLKSKDVDEEDKVTLRKMRQELQDLLNHA